MVAALIRSRLHLFTDGFYYPNICKRAKTEEERGRILRRFGPVVTAKSMQELSHHLRGLIQLCKAKGVRLDYVQLAGDIYRFQFLESRKEVQLSWGQDFYYVEKGEKQ